MKYAFPSVEQVSQDYGRLIHIPRSHFKFVSTSMESSGTAMDYQRSAIIRITPDTSVKTENSDIRYISKC